MRLIANSEFNILCVLADNKGHSQKEIRMISGLGKHEVSASLKSLIEFGLVYSNKRAKLTKTGLHYVFYYYIYLNCYSLISSEAKSLKEGIQEKLNAVYRKYGNDQSPLENEALELHLRPIMDKHALYQKAEFIFDRELTRQGHNWEKKQFAKYKTDMNRQHPSLTCLEWSPSLAEAMRFAKQIEPYCRSPDMSLRVVFELMPDLYKKHLSWELIDDPSFFPKFNQHKSNAIQLGFRLLANYFGWYELNPNLVETVEKNKNRTVNKIIRCPFLAKAKKMNLETSFDSCQAYCRANIDGLNPKYTHRFDKAMCKGDPYCESIIEINPDMESKVGKSGPVKS
jgi:predicted transcriptional regulator